MEEFPNFNTCLVVFQYSLEFVLVDSKLSRLSKYSFSDFRISDAILFGITLYLSQNKMFLVLLNFLYMRLRFLMRDFI